MWNAVKRSIPKKAALAFVDIVKKTHAVKSYRELMETQWLATERLEEIQFEKLKRLLVHAYENVPYYTRVFEENCFKPDRFQHLDDLQKLPVLTKREVRENFDLLQARNKDQFAPRRRQTSGSTGEPLVFYADRSSHSSIWASNWRAFSAGGFSLGDSIAFLSGGALMPRTTPLKEKIYFLCMNMLQLPAYHLSEGEMERYVTILRNELPYPMYLFSYASAAHLFGRYLAKRGIHDMGFTAIFTTSEVLSPFRREVIQDAFDSQVFDTYGNNESSTYAFECKSHNGLHHGMEHSYLEVLDRNNQPVNLGETGHFIATNLENYAMPIIRYDTGDLGSITGDNCDCGRGLRKIDHILGRSRDFILTPDGRQIHGAFFNHFAPFYKTSWIGAWHVLQDEIDHLTISLRPDSVPEDKDIVVIKGLLTQALGQDLKIDVLIDERLYMTPAGKQKLIESHVAEELIS
jgi:phenylacetate-CoA ligase